MAYVIYRGQLVDVKIRVGVEAFGDDLDVFEGLVEQAEFTETDRVHKLLRLEIQINEKRRNDEQSIRQVDQIPKDSQ
jgi:hypothetical protein